jgi:hypothetical protein
MLSGTYRSRQLLMVISPSFLSEADDPKRKTFTTGVTEDHGVNLSVRLASRLAT